MPETAAPRGARTAAKGECVGELIYLRDFLRARRRARRRQEIEEAIAVIEEAVEFARYCYAMAPSEEKLVRAAKIRQLQELAHYARRQA